MTGLLWGRWFGFIPDGPVVVVYRARDAVSHEESVPVSQLLRALVPVLLLTAACRGLPSTPTAGTVPATVVPTVRLTEVATLPPLPTPSVPVDLPMSCTLDGTLDSLASFLSALSRGDVGRLRGFLASPTSLAVESRTFAVVPREPEALETGLYTERPEAFLDWVERRAVQRERWSVLEFVRFLPLDARRVLVAAALLREADDLMAKPMLGMIEFDCTEHVVISVVAGAVGAEALPASPEGLLVEALQQRPLRPPAAEQPCPRSSWAYGSMVGEGPVYLGLGPDAVVNLGDRNATSGQTIHTELQVAASERGPILVRLFHLPEVVPLAVDGQPALFIEPNNRRERSRSVELQVEQPGCYVLQADGVTWQTQLVFEAVPDALAALAPNVAAVTFPAELRVVSALRESSETVRVGLVGPTLVARLSISVAGPGGPTAGPEAHCDQVSERVQLCWVPHPVWGWPQTAVWDDGLRRYQLVVLAGSRDAWSEEEFLELVRQVSMGGEEPGPP